MPKTTQTTVTQNENGQYQVTVPKALADGLNLAGEKVQWEIESGKRLSFSKIDE